MTTNTGWNARSRLMEQLAKNIYSTNKTFKKPSGVIEVEVEKYTYPLQLPSDYTPEDMRMTELFREGTEPTEISTRYNKLQSPTGGSYQLNGSTVTLSWNEIKTPDAINASYLQDYFNEHYGKFASKYYEDRIESNTKTMGTQGYQVYLQDETGTLTNLGWVNDNSYTQTLELGKSYKFAIKSAYKIFKDNESDGLIINVDTQNSDIENIITPSPDETPEEPSTPSTDTGLD